MTFGALAISGLAFGFAILNMSTEMGALSITAAAISAAFLAADLIITRLTEIRDILDRNGRG
jgi:hypothetical protein